MTYTDTKQNKGLTAEGKPRKRRVAEKQADNITELTKLVAIQANTVATLIGRTG